MILTPTRRHVEVVSVTLFGFSQCIISSDINHIMIWAGSNDGWNIESIFSFVIFEGGGWQLSSIDLSVYQWIDGDSKNEYKQEFIIYIERASLYILWTLDTRRSGWIFFFKDAILVICSLWSQCGPNGSFF